MRIHAIPVSLLVLWSVAGTSSLYGQALCRPSDHWVATDALGRMLPNHRDTGPRRAGKHVGVFYFVWVGSHTQKVYDNSKILQKAQSARKWGPFGATHFWGEPEQGYFHASDPWVIRRDMQMLVNADVDFIFLDVTNTLIYAKTVDQLLKVIKQMRKEGIPAPGVVFMTNTRSGRTINRIYDRFYKDPKHRGLWFAWAGRPLIFGIKGDPELRKELLDYFTIKRSWAWTAAKTKPDHWQWLDTYPQDYGWSRSPNVADQIPVSAASHATNSIGKSYHKGKQPAVRPDYTTEHMHRGLHFEEQWGRAHQVDPKVVMITSWNEWIAGRFRGKGPLAKAGVPFAGRPWPAENHRFVDAYTAEFNRDIAPMRGGYTDNYYYQMVGHIRRFKGLAAPPKRPAPRAIRIDGAFKDWEGIAAVHQDPPGDTMHRFFRGTDPKTIYTNTFGRNDIQSVRVVEGKQHVHFMVTTAADLTPHTDEHWMILLVDKDQSKKTGWQGYDLAVNWRAVSPSESKCAKWTGGKWKVEGKVAIGYRGKHLEISVPNTFFPRDPGGGFDFTWVDNVRLTSVESLFLEGDVAPDRRFNFRY